MDRKLTQLIKEYQTFLQEVHMVSHRLGHSKTCGGQIHKELVYQSLFAYPKRNVNLELTKKN